MTRVILLCAVLFCCASPKPAQAQLGEFFALAIGSPIIGLGNMILLIGNGAQINNNTPISSRRGWALTGVIFGVIGCSYDMAFLTSIFIQEARRSFFGGVQLAFLITFTTHLVSLILGAYNYSQYHLYKENNPFLTVRPWFGVDRENKTIVGLSLGGGF